MQTEGCNNFKLGLTGGFQECANCGMEKKFHKLNTSGNSEYIPKNSLTQSTQRQAPPPVKTVAEIVSQSTKLPDGSEVIKESQFTSVKDRMRAFEALKNSTQTSGQYKPSGRASMPPQVTGIRRTETELIPEKVVETQQVHVEKQDEVLKIAEEVDEQLKIDDGNDDDHNQQQQQQVHQQEQDQDQQLQKYQEQFEQQQQQIDNTLVRDDQQVEQQQVDEQQVDDQQEQQQQQVDDQQQYQEQQVDEQQEQQQQYQEQQQQQYQNPMEDDEQQQNQIQQE